MSNIAAEPLQFSPPIPTNASKAAISAYAEQIAQHLQFRPNDLINSLVSQIGGRIEYRNPELDALDRLPESIIVYARGNFVVFVPNMTSSERDRFTIAHELGHYYLHFPLAQQAYPHLPMRATRWVDENNLDLRRTEWEANWFAAAFLMPAESFREAYLACGRDPVAVAARFGVSGRAAEVRVSTLGL